MILYTLVCDRDHQFEAWFRDSVAYDEQVASGDVACPVCGSFRVGKALMAPRIARGRTRMEAEPTVPAAPAEPRQEVLPPPEKRAEFEEMARALRALQEKVEADCDYVGDRFAEEARAIHYGETEARGIYGEATPDEDRALREEGIAFATIPWLPRRNA